MLVKRTIVALILLPIGLAAIFLGGWFYYCLILLFLGLAAWEYVVLFRHGGHQPVSAARCCSRSWAEGIGQRDVAARMS